MLRGHADNLCARLSQYTAGPPMLLYIPNTPRSRMTLRQRHVRAMCVGCGYPHKDRAR
ncbi:hypothetical protein CONPUDRAFT_84193 [Coniophora puteana RWD-64-598 SS2]|uniref:Uncharacterized protein n=1 Tax=Coniophora puteana (strain RWD-64-598) TaxID=741705 RepID=A0A5M3MG47_CONPW|nr:uncharacterized protein CONPUDRAFT_84193 [Coniophora puteana RWD-64-598 SS2]EIW77900.1 hypothetical protein CONPUDRAFT_84193 [Coniophora puteana RWD-64-598 SS2]